MISFNVTDNIQIINLALYTPITHTLTYLWEQTTCSAFKFKAIDLPVKEGNRASAISLAMMTEDDREME